MIQIVLVGLGAGAASALLFASVASGSPLSVVLFYLAPLPILIAAIGWSHWSALIAALAAAIGLAAVFGSFFFLLAFLIGVGLPAWWLGYLALLARTDADGHVEWYPTGRLVLWCAAIAAGLVIIAIPNFGLDEEQFRSGLRRAFERILKDQGRGPAGSALDVTSDSGKRLIDVLVTIMPLAAAVLATVTSSLNLYLAARVVKVSGRFKRPWPDLSDIRFPLTAHLSFAAALFLSFMPGLVGTMGGIVAAALIMAYAILGFSVLHAITRNVGGRSFILSGAYLAVLIIGWPALAMTLLGLADAIFDFRKRAGAAKPPAPTQ
ncbi:MAG: DUF2232 domain-containing protein [Pseudorhodoplanes sp.]